MKKPDGTTIVISLAASTALSAGIIVTEQGEASSFHTRRGAAPPYIAGITADSCTSAIEASISYKFVPCRAGKLAICVVFYFILQKSCQIIKQQATPAVKTPQPL